MTALQPWTVSWTAVLSSTSPKTISHFSRWSNLDCDPFRTRSLGVILCLINSSMIYDPTTPVPPINAVFKMLFQWKNLEEIFCNLLLWKDHQSHPSCTQKYDLNLFLSTESVKDNPEGRKECCSVLRRKFQSHLKPPWTYEYGAKNCRVLLSVHLRIWTAAHRLWSKFFSE